MKNKESTSTTEKRIKITVACVLIVGILCLLLHSYYAMRGHGGATVTSVSFEESGKRLKNPNRGFYVLHGYYIHDKMVDFREDVAADYCKDTESTITLVEINLAEFINGPISDQGLRNIENLFATLHDIDKQLIVRFLYDWNGENIDHEPRSIDIILGHMEQLGPIINDYADDIYMLQGLFIGNWGEMNGTKYANKDDVYLLANKLAEVTDPDIYLAVRMPMYWRMATECAGVTEKQLVIYEGTDLVSRLSIYNDGMLGNALDYGTYGEESREEVGDFSFWNREEEIAFQEELCKYVPNGGEVINPNPYNDFDAAIADLSRMHVSYLNLEYDVNVYDKWNRETVTDNSVFDGQTGKLYIENHLGYRFVITDNRIQYNTLKDEATVSVELQNVGYAPIYKEPETRVLLVNRTTGECMSKPADLFLRSLSGGANNEEKVSTDVTFSMTGQEAGTYEVYLYLEDKASAMPIYLGVEQEMTDYGYLLGTITLKKKSF